MFKKFVYVTGFLDVLLGLGVWIPPLMRPEPGTFVALMTLGAFLMFAGAALMWASKDIEARAPIVFWQALVRLTAVCSVLYAVPNGLASTPWEYAVAVFDGVVSLTYIVGTMRFTGASGFTLLRGRTV
ncbi:MAG: hypothetical protein AAGF92_02550 [Myxococcota bacterium]